MGKTVVNPFITTGYMGPEYFCDRVDETDRILDAIASGRNLTLISLRRMGKTGLLRHVKYKLEHSDRKAAVVYIDLLPSMNANDMLNSMSTALFRLRKEEKNFLEKMLGLLVSLRPKLTIDSLTGEPSIELKAVSPGEVASGLEQILRLISEIRQKIVFMFDEFQQIGNYPEKNIEAVLRSVIQEYPRVAYVFSGSSKHMLENMFLSPDKPFYKSSELMYLGRMNPVDYSGFIADMFSRKKIVLDEKLINRVFDWTRMHTWYVQYVCNHLFERGRSTINDSDLNSLFFKIISDFEPQFINTRNLLPAHQFRLLVAIAAEDGVAQPTSGDFISKYGLNGASSVAASLKALSEKEMIVRESEKWQVYDVFLARWLEYHYKT